MPFLFSFFCFLSYFFSGNPNDPVGSFPPDPGEIPGVIFYHSPNRFDTSYDHLRSSIENHPNLKNFGEINHGENASRAGMVLSSTRIMFFGNPRMGTLLLQQNQLAGLDLPLKVLCYKDKDQVTVIQNSMAYLNSRYGLEKVDILPEISNALQELFTSALEAPEQSASVQEVEELSGLISITSMFGFEETYQRLIQVLEQNENIRIFSQVDHQANAIAEGMELRPTRVVIFGNPKLGTPLMQISNSIGLDLPQKMLIWESEEGTTMITFNDPEFLRKRHGIPADSAEMKKIRMALQGFAETAAKE